MKTINQILDESVPRATYLVLRDAGITIRNEPFHGDAHYDAIAVMGFSGSGFGGALGLAAEMSLVETAYPATDALLADSWLGELSNLLLGRLKNVLLTHGVTISLAIPMVLHGLDIKVRKSDSRIKKFQFVTTHGRVCVWVDASWNLNTELEPAGEDEQPHAEGEMMLF